MKAFSSKKMCCRSLEKRNLMFTTYVSDGDSAAHKVDKFAGVSIVQFNQMF